MTGEPVRKIIHVEMYAFNASVEQRDDLILKGRPVDANDRFSDRC